jgi:hypothetical protein
MIHRRRNVYWDWKTLQWKRGDKPLTKAQRKQQTAERKRQAAIARQDKQHAKIAERAERKQSRISAGKQFRQLRSEAKKEAKARELVKQDRELWRELYGSQNPFPGRLTNSRRRALRRMASKKRKRRNSRSRPFIGPDGKVWHSGKRPRAEALAAKAAQQAAKRMDLESWDRHMRTLKMLEAEKQNPYEVTRKFTGGTLKGLEHTGRTSAPYKVGQRVRKPIGGSPYVITKVRKVNPGIVEAISPGDRVTIINRFGQQSTGRAVMRSSGGGWVLNMGGPHGTPGIASEENIVRVKKKRAKQNPRKRSRKGKMPAGLAAYWRKKRAQKNARKRKKANPKKRRTRRRRPVARRRVQNYRKPVRRRRRKSNPPRKRPVKIIKTNLRKGTKAFRQFVSQVRAQYGKARVL